MPRQRSSSTKFFLIINIFIFYAFERAKLRQKVETAGYSISF